MLHFCDDMHKAMIFCIVYIAFCKQLLKYYQTGTKTFRRLLVVQLDSAKNVVASPENLQVLVQF